jgi:structural maintenance of chromosome 4
MHIPPIRSSPSSQRFSSVVGPNGSGKSNVIDAMLFVFGKRAAQMRLKKLPELIHRSDAYPDLEYAQVSVHFQEIIDYLVRACACVQIFVQDICT